MSDRSGTVLGLVVFAAVVALVVLVLFGPIYSVDAGEGAVLLTGGSVSSDTIGSGFHLKMPLYQSVEKFDVKTQKYTATASAASKDLQTVTTTVALNYHLQFDKIPAIYSNVGHNYGENIIQPKVQEVVKASTAKYNADQLITERPLVKDTIEKELTARLTPYGITVDQNGVSITDFEFSKEFSDAIEQKVVSVQLRQKAENDLQTEKVKAEIKATQGKGEADALALLKLQATPEVIRLKELDNEKAAIDKWNGAMPYLVGSGVTPFVNVPTSRAAT